MRVLLTGHNGYIGSVMAPILQAAGHEVHGLDAYLFEECTFGEPASDIPARRLDVRDVRLEHLRGFEAVIHLAALSNDPLGNLNPALTYEINHQASVRLAELARAAGVRRFLFASSCSLYGVSGDAMLTEEAAFNPITAYGESKVLAERDLAALADDRFSPVFLRNATAYGCSPRLRADVVVNNLVLAACMTREVLLQSDGTPWRPLVHVEDISRAFLAALEAPTPAVHNQAFNVGQTAENYRVREIAELVARAVPGSVVRYAEGAGPDSRCYRVDCGKIRAALPRFRPVWTLERGIDELCAALSRFGVPAAADRYIRMKRIGELLEADRIGHDLRWRPAAAPAAAAR